MDSNQLDALLQELDAKVDKADPQQALVSLLSHGLRTPVHAQSPPPNLKHGVLQLLQQARAHTRALQQARGDWERRSTSRSWNADALPEKDTPPLELSTYR